MRINSHIIFHIALRFARKNGEFFEENCMSLGRFLQRFCVQQARCERTMHAEMVLEVLQMIYGISAAFECNLRLFARILGAEVGRFRSKIARFCV